jgi:hypothetical protein
VQGVFHVLTLEFLYSGHALPDVSGVRWIILICPSGVGGDIGTI